MIVRSLAIMLSLAALTLACDDSSSSSPGDVVTTSTDTSDAGSDADTTPSLAMTFSDAPVAGLPDGVRFASAIPYGADPEQVIDVFLPAATAPTAAILYIHGGGFTQGTRLDAYEGGAASIHTTLEAGVAWIGVDYRLLLEAGAETEGVIKSLHDSQRALQFVRYYAASLNIDPTRIAVTGVSAGAGTGLWLALHDDMADPDSADPIARQSTRLATVGAVWPQSTYDVVRWVPDVFNGEYSFVTIDVLLSQPALRELLVQFYGLDIALADDGDALQAAVATPAMLAYRADVDMLALMSPDDPAIYLYCDVPDRSPLDAGFDLLHHPLHDQALITAGAAAGVTIEADVPAYDVSSGVAGDHPALTFILDVIAH